MRGWRAYLLSHGSWPARESGRHFATEEEEEEKEEEEREVPVLVPAGAGGEGHVVLPAVSPTQTC